MKISAALKHKTALLLLLAFLHGMLAPALGMASGHALHADMLASVVCGQHSAAQHAQTDHGIPHSHAHDAFCLLCCCPSAPAEIAPLSHWLVESAVSPAPLAPMDAAFASALRWHPALPRAPPRL